MKHKALSSLLAAGMLLMPLLSTNGALAGDIVNLPPLRDEYGATPDTFYNTNVNAVNMRRNETVSLRGRVSTIPRGTMLMIKLEQPVSSFSNRVGDQISATLENDIFVNDSIAIPAGSEVMGQVANVEDAGRMGRHGSVDIRFQGIRTPDNQVIPIRAHVVTTDQSGILKGDTYKKDILKSVAIAASGTGVGTLMGLSAGALIGSAGAGALFGLSAGALGGMGYALLRKGKEVIVPTGSRMSIVIDQPVNVNL